MVQEAGAYLDRAPDDWEEWRVGSTHRGHSQSEDQSCNISITRAKLCHYSINPRVQHKLGIRITG